MNSTHLAHKQDSRRRAHRPRRRRGQLHEPGSAMAWFAGGRGDTRPTRSESHAITMMCFAHHKISHQVTTQEG
jgi:hypothetical protein